MAASAATAATTATTSAATHPWKPLRSLRGGSECWGGLTASLSSTAVVRSLSKIAVILSVSSFVGLLLANPIFPFSTKYTKRVVKSDDYFFCDLTTGTGSHSQPAPIPSNLQTTAPRSCPDCQGQDRQTMPRPGICDSTSCSAVNVGTAPPTSCE